MGAGPAVIDINRPRTEWGKVSFHFTCNIHKTSYLNFLKNCIDFMAYIIANLFSRQKTFKGEKSSTFAAVNKIIISSHDNSVTTQNRQCAKCQQSGSHV